MSSTVLSTATAASFRQSCAGFEPELLSGADCAALAEELAATEKACGAPVSGGTCCRLRCSSCPRL
jgi:hypothetical protein